MPKGEKNSQFVAVKSMFLSGSVKRMKDIEKLYPTLIAKSLHINHSRYVQKLYKPDGFTIGQIDQLAKLLDIDVQLILNVIINQLNSASPKTIRRKSE
jgi:hypothetical protein